VTEEVLVTMGIGKGSGERTSATMWMGHEVRRRGDGQLNSLALFTILKNKYKI
jgi:hypothetical protein